MLTNTVRLVMFQSFHIIRWVFVNFPMVTVTEMLSRKKIEYLQNNEIVVPYWNVYEWKKKKWDSRVGANEIRMIIFSPIFQCTNLMCIQCEDDDENIFARFSVFRCDPLTSELEEQKNEKKIKQNY